MAYPALDVAKYIIWYSKENGYPISNLRLQKLLYFVQANFLVSVRRPCFEEPIEAWSFGPVVPSVYHEFKHYGSASIQGHSWKNAGELIRGSDQTLIDEIVDYCARYSTSGLVEITHNQSPWLDVYKPRRNAVISQRSIRQFFEEGEDDPTGQTD